MTGEEVMPVAWRVKDYADGWILYATETEARRAASNDERGSGGLIEPLYRQEALELAVMALREIQFLHAHGYPTVTLARKHEQIARDALKSLRRIK